MYYNYKWLCYWPLNVLKTLKVNENTEIYNLFKKGLHRITSICSLKKIQRIINGNRSHFWDRWSLYTCTNIDRWLIIGDNYLLNVFTDYSYSNSLISRVWLTNLKVKRRMELYCIRTHIYFFFICSGRWWLYTDWNTTILVAETFLLNTICFSFSSVNQEYWDFIIDDFHQNGLL